MSGALDGITVVDFSRILAGPYAAMLLGDMGARVIKIEQPGSGDDTRRWGPPFTHNGESSYFLCVNRNKESVTLDLKSTTGQQIAREMVKRADIVIENFKVGGMAAMGLSYADLSIMNPALIYCSITGYGQTGPYRERSGYDAVIQAQGGVMSIIGPAPGEPGEGHPYKVGVAITDITAGLNAVTAILAALYHRTVTGMGQAIDIALFDTQVSWLANVAGGYLVSGETPLRYGNAHPSIVPYQTMQAADGWFVLAVGNDQQFRKLCSLLGHPEWAENPHFVTNQARVSHRTELLSLLEPLFLQDSAIAWTTRLGQVGIPTGPVNDIPTALADPQIAARDMVQKVEHPITGPIALVGPVPKFGSTPAAIRKAPPLLGEDTRAVLQNWLGYSEQEIRRLASAGVI